MKVRLTRTDWTSEEKLSEAYPILKTYPSFEDHKDNWSHFAYIELNTMEDLCKLIEDLDEELVVDYDEEFGRTIEIYDDYRE